MKFLTWLNGHKTKVTGVLLIAAGSLQANATAVQAVVSPKGYAMFTIGVGIFVAVLGFLNSQKSAD